MFGGKISLDKVHGTVVLTHDNWWHMHIVVRASETNWVILQRAIQSLVDDEPCDLSKPKCMIEHPGGKEKLSRGDGPLIKTVLYLHVVEPCFEPWGEVGKFELVHVDGINQTPNSLHRQMTVGWLGRPL